MRCAILGIFMWSYFAVGHSGYLFHQYRFDCPGSGLYPDDDNCQCFYDCANGTPFHMCCPQGTLYDTVHMVCDFDYHVNCGDRPGPGSTRSSTTSTTTTTTTITTTTSTTSSTTTTT